MWSMLLLIACGGPEVVEKPSPPEEQAPNAQSDTDAEDAEPAEGLWNKAREPLTLQEEIAALEAIGYVGGDEPATAKIGVTIHEPTATPGLNFWVSGHAPHATLMDMDGKVLHEWSKSYTDAFPGGERYNNVHGAEMWRRAHLYPNGDILAVFEGHGLVKLDKDSKVLWRYDGRAHHDIEVLPDGRIWTLTRKGSLIPRVNLSRAVLEDYAVLLSPKGEVLKEISLLEAFDKSDKTHILYDRSRRRGDIFHTNSLEMLDGEAAKANPAFKAGNILLSMRTLSTIMVLDPEQEAMVWVQQGRFKRQHDPKILDNGHLLLFDNMGHRGRSAVREYEVGQMKQVWAYWNSEAHPFFTRFTGAAYRFDNGHTLIAESGYGRVFEIDGDDKTIWEFHNPNRAGDEGQFVAIIPDMIRLPLDYVTFLD